MLTCARTQRSGHEHAGVPGKEAGDEEVLGPDLSVFLVFSWALTCCASIPNGCRNFHRMQVIVDESVADSAAQ